MKRLVAFVSLGVLACNAVLGINPPNVNDASSGDAGFNYVRNASFTSPSACAFFTGPGLELTAVGGGQGDDHACQVCSPGGGAFFGISQVLPPTTFNEGETYHFEAWVRAPIGAAAASSISVELEIDRDRSIQQPQAAGPPLAQEWKRVSGDLIVTAEAARNGNLMAISILSRIAHADTVCFVVDDVLVAPNP
jgi:hypothetical protein